MASSFGEASAQGRAIHGDRTALMRWTTGIAAATNLGLGLGLGQPWLALGGVLGLSFVGLRWRSSHGSLEAGGLATAEGPPPRRPRRICPTPAADPRDLDALVEEMLAQGRYALLLRPQIAQSLSEEQFRRALAALEEDMALVPDGDVFLGPIDEGAEDGRLDEASLADRPGRIVQVQRFFLDRYPVTNAQYEAFVAAGGYEQPALWDPSILPAVLDFVDQTGRPGPRYWRNGTYPPGREDHPVVGVNWYEASAYARWMGKRLPTDAEWVKAASWPVRLSPTTRLQRRYPWGDTMDRTKANVWGSGPGDTVPVQQFAEGVSVGGVYQLSGNVWEWMWGNYVPPDGSDGSWAAEIGLKSLRGGAFDTYFDNQATCQFQSGDAAVARKANIGFRLAIGACDVVLAWPGADPAAPCPAPCGPEVEL